MEKTYIIKYGYYLKDNKYSSPNPIKVKKCMSDIHAKVKLEQYLKKHQPDFVRLVVYSCKEDVQNPFGDIFSENSKNIFKDIFGNFDSFK